MEKAPYPYAGLPPLSANPEPLIYISGPMNSSGVMVENIRRALDVATAIRHAGGLPFVPQLHFLWEAMSPQTAEFFLAMDREYVRRSKALFRLRGPSFGAGLEEGWAREFNIPVYLEENGSLGRLLSDLRVGAYR